MQLVMRIAQPRLSNRARSLGTRSSTSPCAPDSAKHELSQLLKNPHHPPPKGGFSRNPGSPA